MRNLNIKHFQFKRYKDASCAFLYHIFCKLVPLRSPPLTREGFSFFKAWLHHRRFSTSSPWPSDPPPLPPYTSFVLCSLLLFHIQPSFMFLSPFSAPSTELEAREEEEFITRRDLPKSRKPSAFQGLQ